MSELVATGHQTLRLLLGFLRSISESVAQKYAPLTRPAHRSKGAKPRRSLLTSAWMNLFFNSNMDNIQNVHHLFVADRSHSLMSIAESIDTIETGPDSPSDSEQSDEADAHLVGPDDLDAYLSLMTHDTIQLVLSFFDDALYWSISGDALDAATKSFRVRGIDFACIVCPNGVDRESRGWLMPCLAVVALPSHVASVWLCYDICCVQAHRVCAFKAMQRVCDERHVMSWDVQTLRLSDCAGAGAIDLIVTVDVLKVMHKAQAMHSLSMSMSSCPLRFEWVIASNTLRDAFQYCPFKVSLMILDFSFSTVCA